MKTIKTLIFVITILAIASCKKETPIPRIASDNYVSMNDFFSKNNVPMQTYTIDASIGGSFVSPQGTIVNIPANTFLTQSYIPVLGDITIQFKDIYKKSDMLLSKMTTLSIAGTTLKSGGEFFIKAISSNSSLILSSGKKITIIQPAILTGGIDSLNTMQSFVFGMDGFGPINRSFIKYLFNHSVAFL